MNPKEMSLSDLKVLAYDQLREAQRIQTNLRILETEIAAREKQVGTPIDREAVLPVNADTQATN